MGKNRHEEVKGILDQQKQLKQAREKVKNLLDKNIFIISGDYTAREEIKGNLATLGFHHENVKASNSPAETIRRIKQNTDAIDLIICNLKILDSHASSQTGLQLLNIVNDMLLNLGVEDKIPFMFIDKNFEKQDIVAAIKAGASQFLLLPTNSVSLGNKLAEIFKKPESFATSNEITTLLFEANKFREQGLFEKALNLYNKALKISRENVDILTEKANTLLEMGDIDEAIKIFKHILEIENKLPRAYQGLGMAYEQLGDIAEAKDNYLKVQELEPGNVQICYNIGALFQKEGNYDKAELHFEKGIKLNKKFLKNFTGLAKNYEEQEKFKKALDVYKEALNFNPDQSFLYLKAGDLCMEFNQYEHAEKLFSRAIEKNDSNIHLYNRMGIALRKQKKYKDAILNYSKAIDVSPGDAILYYNQAKAYFFEREEAKAVKILSIALDLDHDLMEKLKIDKPFSRLLTDYKDELDRNKNILGASKN